jgi:hypothetical protein
MRPVLGEASYGNVVLSCGVGNHVDLRGLPGGAEGIQTDGHRGLTPPGRETRPENRSGGHLGHQLDLALFRYHIAWVATGGQTIAAAQSAEKAGHRQSARELHLRASAF